MREAGKRFTWARKHRRGWRRLAFLFRFLAGPMSPHLSRYISYRHLKPARISLAVLRSQGVLSEVQKFSQLITTVFFLSLRKIKVPVSKPKIAACLIAFYSRILKSRPKMGRVLCSPAAQQSGFHAHSNTKEINSLCDQRHFWVVKSNSFTSDTTALLSIWKWRENSPLPPRNSKTKNQYIREKQAHQRVLSQNIWKKEESKIAQYYKSAVNAKKLSTSSVQAIVFSVLSIDYFNLFYLHWRHLLLTRVISLHIKRWKGFMRLCKINQE